MWIFMNDAFLSVVAHADRPGHLHVRGRVRGDIERVFPEAEVLETPAGDYRFRADVARSDVARVLAERVEHIDYTNFKSSVPEHDRHDTYLEVWSSMTRLQRTRAARPGSG